MEHTHLVKGLDFALLQKVKSEIEAREQMDKGKAEERRKRKTYYAKLRKDEDDKMAELAAKYRDRARERRDGAEGGVVGEESTNAYRAVAPNARETHDAAERRRQMIHESNY